MPTRYEHPDAMALVVPASTTGASTTAPVSTSGEAAQRTVQLMLKG